jgi:hypothetical protein
MAAHVSARERGSSAEGGDSQWRTSRPHSNFPARRSGQGWRRGCAAAAAVFATAAGLLALAPASSRSLSFFLLQDDTSMGRVPKSWGGYAHGLGALSTDWGGFSHGRQPPVRGGRATHAAALAHAASGAPGVDAADETAPPAGPTADSSHGEEFGSKVGRALAGQGSDDAGGGSGGGGLHVKYLADEQKAVLAARDLLHHPLRAVTHDAETSDARAPASPHGAAWGHGQHGSDDARHDKASWLSASPWRRTHMEAAERRVEKKERDQEAGMSRLRHVIADDRRDLQQARDELQKAGQDLKTAKHEEVHAAKVRQANSHYKLELDKLRVDEMDARRSVLHKVARARARRARETQRVQHTQLVDSTLSRILAQAQGESAQAMQLRESALKALAAAHELKKEAASLTGLGKDMDGTAAADIAAARRAVQAGRKSAQQMLAQGAHTKQSAVAAAAAEAAHAEAEMKRQSAAAAALRKEANAYKHEAARLLINADMQAARAPRDLSVAARVQSTAHALRAHVAQVEQALSGAERLRQERLQQRQPQLLRQNARKMSAVARLSQLKLKVARVKQTLQEAQAHSLKSTLYSNCSWQMY